MSLLATYYISPSEKKNYTVGYAKWLDDGEKITEATVNAPAGFSTSVAIVEDSTALRITAGPTTPLPGTEIEEGDSYLVNIFIETNGNQKKEDCLMFIMELPCA